MQRALVTGGGGFLGLYIVEQLRAQGVDVRVLCRGDYPELRALRVECLQGDIRDPAAVARACADRDTVFHVAAVPGIWGPWSRYYEINTQGTANVVAGCLQQGVARLIYTSSPSVVYDGRDHVQADESLPYPAKYLCHYPHSKALAEQQVLAHNGTSGLATVSLRPHLIWGPRDNHLIPRLLDRARAGKLLRVGDGQNLISMSYVENAAAAHLQVAAKLTHSSPAAGRAYFINDPDPVNLWDWVNQLLDLADLPPLRRSLSLATAYRLGMLLEGVWSLLRLSGEPRMTRFLALQLAGTHTYSIGAAQRDFGYTPIVSAETALARLASSLPRGETVARSEAASSARSC